MIARLWWKEYRQFWPIWVTVALGAALAQWSMLRYFGDGGLAPEELRNGWLVPAALIWACLYAVAIGAAAFAGERELKTLTLLDTLPVGRGTLWTGKASFAIVSTFALAVVLYVLSASATHHYDPQYDRVTILIGYSILILEALCWGLFWSSISKSALAAATLAIFSLLTIAISPLVALAFGQGMLNAVLQRVVIMGITLGASALIITAPRRSSWRWRTPRIEIRMPIVVQPSPRRATRDHVSTWESWSTAIWRLIWATIREGRSTWGLLVAIGIVPYLVLLIDDRAAFQIAALANVVIAITAGVSLFGIEHRAGTQRFLASHGVRPGAVWVTKVAVWTCGLLLIWSPYLVIATYTLATSYLTPNNTEPFWIYLSFVANGLVLSVLSGMALRRGITAWFIAIITTIGVVVPQGFLSTTGMLSPGWMVVPPLTILVVSWAWSGDWLVERPGIGRWVRLGMLLLGALVVSLTSYVGSRAWGVPDHIQAIDRQFLQLEITTVPEESNAAPIYRRAARALTVNSPIDAQELKRQQATIDQIRLAATFPACQFMRPDTLTMFHQDGLGAGQFNSLGQLMLADALAKQKLGDLAGAWNDVVVTIKMARQIGRQAPMGQAFAATRIESQAIAYATIWATDPKQTPDLLKAALTEFRALPAPAPPDETIRVEARIADQTLSLLTEQLREKLLDLTRSANVSEIFYQRIWMGLKTTPWELTRTRRVFRLLFASDVNQARLEPWQRQGHPSALMGFNDTLIQDGDTARFVDGSSLESYFQTTPLVKQLYPAMNSYLGASGDLEVGRRALPQLLAIRVWQFAHGGKVSPDLDGMLKPLDVSSKDPYLDRPFRWVRSEGPLLSPSTDLGKPSRNTDQIADQWVLYSVGGDQHDDWPQGFTGEVFRSDLVFPLPPLPAQAGEEPTEETKPKP